ncbi:hypothetical protein CAEBREN_28922 [Caenorhabditis brenneri]|uniref:AIP/AIPL N-terminal FKBP-type PPIase domain-containing protein n=1 Tax=Caenorhabditis brenneri TaxID=135651 RepID=G0NQZ7_CAEBE|nr:hypothetical protein CAEBREN_28922 [Caenorhabditis brenneri]
MEAIDEFIKKNKVLTLPRISSQAMLDEICPVSSRSPRHLSVILPVTSHGSETEHVDAFRRYVKDTQTMWKGKKVNFAYMYVDKQKDWMRPFAEKRKEKLKNEGRDLLKARFTWLEGAWTGHKETDDLIMNVVEQRKRLDETCTVGNVNDEYGLSIFTRCSRAFWRMWEVVWFHLFNEETYMFLSAVGSLFMIMSIGWLCSYFNEKPSDFKKRKPKANDVADLTGDPTTTNEWHPDDPNTKKKESESSKQQSAGKSKLAAVMKPLIHELRAETYFVFEQCLKTMLVDEISQFDIECIDLVQYPFVSKKLRDIAKTCDGKHSHVHTTHMCAASVAQGTGYNELDELMKNPRPLRFVFHLLKVFEPNEYEHESWQLGEEDKLKSVEELRQKGNDLFVKKESEDLSNLLLPLFSNGSFILRENLLIKEKVDELEEEMKSSNEKIVRIEKELAAQYEVLRKIRSGGNKSGSRGMENKDYAEEKERNRSIVILHVAEGQSRFALENNMEDLKKVNEILKHIDGGTSPVAVYRLGRPRDDNKCRLLKVVMPSSSSQRDILFKAHRLRSYVNSPNPPIYIRRSMSPEELKEYREKRPEKRHKAQTTVTMNNVDVEMSPSDVQPVLTPKN